MKKSRMILFSPFFLLLFISFVFAQQSGENLVSNGDFSQTDELPRNWLNASFGGKNFSDFRPLTRLNYFNSTSFGKSLQLKPVSDGFSQFLSIPVSGLDRFLAIDVLTNESDGAKHWSIGFGFSNNTVYDFDVLNAVDCPSYLDIACETVNDFTRMTVNITKREEINSVPVGITERIFVFSTAFSPTIIDNIRMVENGTTFFENFENNQLLPKEWCFTGSGFAETDNCSKDDSPTTDEVVNGVLNISDQGVTTFSKTFPLRKNSVYQFTFLWNTTSFPDPVEIAGQNVAVLDTNGNGFDVSFNNSVAGIVIGGFFEPINLQVTQEGNFKKAIVTFRTGDVAPQGLIELGNLLNSSGFYLIDNVSVSIINDLTGTTTRVSISSEGVEGNSSSFDPDISSDGRFVVFLSGASNLVPNDTNGAEDVFVHDRQTQTTTRVNVASDGTQANDGGNPHFAISSNGRFVVFDSAATNLVPNDTNGVNDIFVHDRQTKITTRVSIAIDGTEPNGVSFNPDISSDGRFVVFESQASNLVINGTFENNIYLHDRQTGVTELVSVASDGGNSNESSDEPRINSDGRFVAFRSQATNLIPNGTNVPNDIFVRDRQTGVTELVSVASDGTEANAGSDDPISISGDGRFVAFASFASNLVSNDTNGAEDVFVHDRQIGSTTRVSMSSNGTEGNSASSMPSISSDGRFVVFNSFASNLVVGDTNEQYDIFVYDRQTNLTERVSIASDGTEANSYSIRSAINSDGRFIAFDSIASNLVLNDTNGQFDIFVRERFAESIAVQANAGQTVTTDNVYDGASISDPVETSVTTPNSGIVAITETVTNQTPPTGFQFLNQFVNITAPPATINNPLIITFSIDSSIIPPGDNQNTIQIFRNGVKVAACTGSPGVASPDPCVSNRTLLADGDVQIIVLTSTASGWNFGVPLHDAKVEKFDSGGRDLNLGSDGTLTRSTALKFKNNGKHTDLIRGTLEIVGLPAGCAAKNLKTGTTVKPTSGLLVDNISSYTPAQAKSFDFKLNIFCSPIPSPTTITLIARADHGADDGLNTDNDDAKPIDNKIVHLHTLKK